MGGGLTPAIRPANAPDLGPSDTSSTVGSSFDALGGAGASTALGGGAGTLGMGGSTSALGGTPGGTTSPMAARRARTTSSASSASFCGLMIPVLLALPLLL